MHPGRALVSVVALSAVALAALLAASGISSLVEGTLSSSSLVTASLVTAGRAPPRAAPEGRERPSADAILDRNPFEHGSEPHVGLLAPATADEACRGVRPVAIVASDDAGYSFAAFEVGGRRVLRRRGGDVDGMRLFFVGADRVWLERDGALCQAKLFAPPPTTIPSPGSPAGSGAPPHPATPTVRSALEIEVASKIVRRSATDFEIDRSIVDRILEAQSEMMKARVVPEKEGDRVVGVRLFGVKPGSVLASLGLQNGDRLETVNGFEIATPERALEAYARLRAGATDLLTVHVTRGGKPMNIDYTIR